MAESMWNELSWEEHAGFLRRLGQSLLRKEGPSGGALSAELDGDDLVQDAWLLAAERMPGSHPDPRGWLSKSIAHLVRERRRSSERRARRESAAAKSDEQESQAAIAERVELVERVSAAVLELRKPLRTAIHLRYYEGLTPTEIAQRLDVPLENVRTRLRRGRDFLRERLDRSYGSQHAWLLPMAALVDGSAAPPPASLPTSMGSTEGGSAAPYSLTYKTAALAVVLGSMQTKLAVVFGLVTCVGVYLWTRSPAAIPEPLSPATLEPKLSQPAPSEAPSVPSDTREASVPREPVALASSRKPEPEAGRVTIQGTLSIFAGEDPDLLAPDGKVRVLQRGEAQGWVEFAVVRGRWEASLFPGSELILAQFHIEGDPRLAAGRQKRWVVPETGEELALEGRWIPESILRVVDAETGIDLSGLEVRRRTSWRAIGKDEIPGDHRHVQRVLEQGSSPLHLPAFTTMHRTYWVRSPGYAWGRVFFDNETGGERVVELVREAAVRVVTRGSVPEGAKLRLRSRHFPPFHDGEVSPAPGGSTSIEGLLPGRYRISLEVGSFHEITSLGQANVELVAGSEPEVLLDVDRSILDQPLASLSGTLLIPEGHAAEDYSLSFQLVAGSSNRAYSEPRMVEWKVDKENRRRVHWHAEDVAPGSYTVYVDPVYHRLPLDVPEEGRHGFAIELPEAAVANIVFVDPLDAPGGLRPENVTWMDGAVAGLYSNRAPDLLWDKERQCYRLESVAGEVDLSISDSTYGRSKRTLTLKPGEHRIEVPLARQTTVTVSFYGGDARLAELDSGVLWGIELHGPSTSSTGSTNGSSRTFQLEAGGTYELRFPSVEGYAPIAPKRINVADRRNTEVQVQLKRL